MTDSLRAIFGTMCRDARIMLDISQGELATAVGVTRGYIGRIEAGRANPTLALIESVAEHLRIGVRLLAELPTVEAVRQADAVHAWCSGYVSRRLRRAGWDVRREVLVGSGGRVGWIDILAYHPGRRVLLIIEIKTRLDDLGAIERQLAWYERMWRDAYGPDGWRPVRICTWLLALQSDEVETFLRNNRSTLADAFPLRATTMRIVASGAEANIANAQRGLAMIDPTSRREQWLTATAVDGRRTRAAFRNYADAVTRARRG